MSTQNYFVFTSAERTTAMAFNGPEFGVAPRPIDSATPMTGKNINPDAVDYEIDETVELIGKFVAPVRIVNDPDYLANEPDMVDFLLTLPACLLEDETIFLPPEEI